MNDKRPARLYQPVAARPGTRTITLTLTDKRQLTITPPSESAIETLSELTASINSGGTMTFNDPDGSKTVINSAHVITVELR